MKRGSKQPNPYSLAFFTAIMAGIFSTVGSYFATSFQARHAIEQKHFEFRAQAYSGFLEKIDHVRAPVVSEFLHTGLLAEELDTDADLQSLENRMTRILSEIDVQELYWRLNSDLTILRLYGSPMVQCFCEDILKTLILQHDEIDWSIYPARIKESYEQWRASQEKTTDTYIELQISNEERLRFIMISKLYTALIQQLRYELQSVTP